MRKYIIIVTFVNNKNKILQTNNRHFAQSLMNKLINYEEVQSVEMKIVRDEVKM